MSAPFLYGLSLGGLRVSSRPVRSSENFRHSLFLCALSACALVAGPSVARAEPPAADAPHVQPPVVIEESRPPYPTEAGGVKGDVAVTATITTTGDVSGVELTTGVAPALDRAALERRDELAVPAGAPRRRPGRQPRPAAVSLRAARRAVRPTRPPPVPAPAPTASVPSATAPPPSAPMPVAVPLPELAPPTEPATGPTKGPAALDVNVLGRRPPLSRGVSDFQIRVGRAGGDPARQRL